MLHKLTRDPDATVKILVDDEPSYFTPGETIHLVALGLVRHRGTGRLLVAAPGVRFWNLLEGVLDFRRAQRAAAEAVRA